MRVALKSPPTMLSDDEMGGKVDQKGCWTVLAAGAYTFLMLIRGECGGMMVMSRMRWSFDSKVSVDLICGAMKVATKGVACMVPCHMEDHVWILNFCRSGVML